MKQRYRGLRPLVFSGAALVACILAATAAAVVGGSSATSGSGLFQAPEANGAASASGAPACTYPDSTAAKPHVHPFIHCYTAGQIRAAYGVDRVSQKGDGQTIVLVDSYGSPTATADLTTFHDAFFPNEPAPSFEQVFPFGAPDYKNDAKGNGQSGPAAAAGWAGEATLDIEWAYAIAPHAHIVLLAVPPAETEGVQGFPNLFKAISDQIDARPSGTVFSMSFGVTEQTFGGAAQVQTAKFDAVLQRGIAKGDTFFASSGDSGSLGVAKQHRDTATYNFPTDGWPASSPYVTSVGGTQLQYGWTWNPSSDIAFNADGSFNTSYWQSTDGGHTDVVWNESWLTGATGGGPSAIYSRPAWQGSVLGAAGDHRLVPDLAWNAAVNGGVLVYTSFFPNASRVGWHIYGGTSSGSPQVAALTALGAQKAGHGLGNINSAVYGSAGAWFTDVVPVHQGSPGVISGDLTSNRMFDYNGDGLAVSWDPVAGWPTTSGYDETTGWGTPWAPSYVSGLAGP
jgi:subtilase family serine protease